MNWIFSRSHKKTTLRISHSIVNAWSKMENNDALCSSILNSFKSLHCYHHKSLNEFLLRIWIVFKRCLFVKLLIYKKICVLNVLIWSMCWLCVEGSCYCFFIIIYLLYCAAIITFVVVRWQGNLRELNLAHFHNSESWV